MGGTCFLVAGAYLHGAHAHGLSVHHLSCYAWLQGSPTFYMLEKSTKWPNSRQVNHEKKKFFLSHSTVFHTELQIFSLLIDLLPCI